jgi:hypothetical protein
MAAVNGTSPTQDDQTMISWLSWMKTWKASDVWAAGFSEIASLALELL